jgi:hypothetical protein
MSRVERIKELMKLHEDGAISSLELGELIKGLNDEEPSRSGASSSDSESLPPPDVQRGIASVGSQNAGAESPTVVENNKSSRLRIVAVFAVLLVAAAVFVLTRKGDPTESQEYQKLLKKQELVEDEISKIEAELSSLRQSVADSESAHSSKIEPLDVELEDWKSRAERTMRMLQDVESVD